MFAFSEVSKEQKKHLLNNLGNGWNFWKILGWEECQKRSLLIYSFIQKTLTSEVQWLSWMLGIWCWAKQIQSQPLQSKSNHWQVNTQSNVYGDKWNRRRTCMRECKRERPFFDWWTGSLSEEETGKLRVEKALTIYSMRERAPDQKAQLSWTMGHSPGGLGAFWARAGQWLRAEAQKSDKAEFQCPLYHPLPGLGEATHPLCVLILSSIRWKQYSSLIYRCFLWIPRENPCKVLGLQEKKPNT